MNTECSEHSWRVPLYVCVCLHLSICVRKHRYGMLLSAPIPPCQYLLSILRFEERQLVSIFMDVVKHEILTVFPNPVTVCTHTHTHTVGGKDKRSERNPRTAFSLLILVDKVY